MYLFGRLSWTGLRVLALGLGVLCGTAAQAQERTKLIAFTGYLPPLSIDAENKGIAVELMELVAEEAGLEIEVRFAPWKRAQVLAENTSGSLLFTAAYSRARGEKFQYVAPLIYTESAFITLDQPLDTFEKAIESGKVIGVHLGSQRSRILKRLGVGNIEEIPTAEQMSTMLHTGRIDAWYTMSIRANFVYRQQGLDPKKLVVGAPVTHGIQWLAANKDLDPKIRARLASAVSRVWRDQRYWQIVDQYAPSEPALVEPEPSNRAGVRHHPETSAHAMMILPHRATP
ncbi:ABC transporter substrate-binding protein [Labrenzia sp. VG12]|uniref:substrate-binding periplasmic protein n=1 Tax=Labrenzia sp. VG12 TaxID=2021862 RepID=UPI001AD9016D|nr:transporter substrate-binding domain-containing protein [Labrenzia sp. VG12]